MHEPQFVIDDSLERRRAQKFGEYREIVLAASRGESFDASALETLLRDLGQTKVDFRRHVVVARARRIAATVLLERAESAVKEESEHLARIASHDAKIAKAKEKYEASVKAEREKQKEAIESWKRVSRATSHSLRRLSQVILTVTMQRESTDTPQRRAQIAIELRRLERLLRRVDPAVLEREIRELGYQLAVQTADTKSVGQFDDPHGFAENVQTQNLEHRLAYAQGQLRHYRETEQRIAELRREDAEVLRSHKSAIHSRESDVELFDWDAPDHVVVDGRAVDLSKL